MAISTTLADEPGAGHQRGSARLARAVPSAWMNPRLVVMARSISAPLPWLVRHTTGRSGSVPRPRPAAHLPEREHARRRGLRLSGLGRGRRADVGAGLRGAGGG